jgi:hypothetical protein
MLVATCFEPVQLLSHNPFVNTSHIIELFTDMDPVSDLNILNIIYIIFSIVRLKSVKFVKS